MIQSGEEIFVPYSDEFWEPEPESRIQRRKRLRQRREAAGRKRISPGAAIESAGLKESARKTGRLVGADERVNLFIQDVLPLIAKIGTWAEA
jgi:hypothetical protein